MILYIYKTRPYAHIDRIHVPKWAELSLKTEVTQLVKKSPPPHLK
jgi:hypothetical protein